VSGKRKSADHGKELCKIQERMLRIKDSMEIEDPGGNRLAMVKKALIAPLRDRQRELLPRSKTAAYSARPVLVKRCIAQGRAPAGRFVIGEPSKGPPLRRSQLRIGL
jgi:hypothetical protein